MRYDTVIVGAGTSGGVLAARLSEDAGRSVLLLEAGPDYLNFEQTPDEVKHAYGEGRKAPAGPLAPGSLHNWDYRARSTSSAPPMEVPRGRVVGGSGAVNATIFLRGVPEDYDAWARDGAEGWSFKDLLPYFCKVESDMDFADDFHGTAGPVPVRRFRREQCHPDQLAFEAACRKLGFQESPDHNGPDSAGIGPVPLNNAGGVRWSSALTYLTAARHRPNLTVRGGCLARRVVIEDGRATGVIVESGGETYAVHAGEVVVCAGAIASPHLLMLSGVGPAAQLESVGVSVCADLPGVGKNLRDHPQVRLLWETKPGYTQSPLGPRIQFLLRYTASGSSLRNDMLIHPLSYEPEKGVYAADPEGGDAGIGMIASIYQAAGWGEVRLASGDPHQHPVIDYNYLAEESDRRRLREGVRICMRLAAGAAFEAYTGRRLDPLDQDLKDDASLDKWMARRVRTSHHASGTCRMGGGADPLAVVDSHGRVYGVRCLRVADASVMPDCIRANTNATTFVIGEKIAAHMRAGG